MQHNTLKHVKKVNTVASFHVKKCVVIPVSATDTCRPRVKRGHRIETNHSSTGINKLSDLICPR